MMLIVLMVSGTVFVWKEIKMVPAFFARNHFLFLYLRGLLFPYGNPTATMFRTFIFIDFSVNSALVAAFYDCI
jgi:hypothetical protein